VACLEDLGDGVSRSVPIAIVGGGWAGLACAITLAEADVPVTLFESARQLGGRARAVVWDELTVDNGQHLMVGAYRQTLALLALLGTRELIERRPLDLRLPGFRLALPRLPAPLHLAVGLLKARGLSWGEKFAAVRFMQGLKRQGFRLPQDKTAADFLRDQPAVLVDRLWGPICIAALNTPLAQASAQVFCNVLRDSLMGACENSDLVLNRADLGRLLPAAAVSYLRRAGTEIHLSSRVEGVRQTGHGFHLDGPEERYGTVVLAAHPSQVPTLTASLPQLDDLRHTLSGFTWQPILTLWLRFESAPVFPFPMLGLGPGQAPWAFERNDLGEGVVSIVASAEGPHLALTPEALLADFLKLLGEVLGPLPKLLAWKLITEKRATFACVPATARPDNATALPGLYLAGDYTAGPYPATLEGAVRSGVKCAQLLLE
jgi:squalene-associated FAD-dependent desaturase